MVPSVTPLRRAMLSLALLLPILALAPAASATANLDARLFRTYSFDPGFTQAQFVECGELPNTSGCFAFGSFGPIGHIGAMMEGIPVVDNAAGTATRKVYIVDQAVGRGTSTRMNLVVYQLDTTFDASSANTTVTKVQTIPLPLTGGLKAHTYMAANAGHLFIGTDQGGTAVRVSKTSYAVASVAGFTPSIDVSSITADAYGFVDVTFGALNGADGVHRYDPTGASLGVQRGASFKLGTGQGLSTSDVLARQAAATPAIVRYHATTPVVGAANTNPDAGLSIDYAFDPTFKNLTYSVCGTVPGSSGCYASGTVGSFGHVGALLEDVPVVDAVNNTVTRNLYVLDQSVGGHGSTVAGLYVYSIVETINAPNVAVSVGRTQSIGVPLVGGAQVKAFIASSHTTLFVGTNQSSAVTTVAKSDWSVFNGGGNAPPYFTDITADHYGFAGFTYGGITGNNGYEFYGPNGVGGGGGGGQGFLLGTEQALSTSDVVTKPAPF